MISFQTSPDAVLDGAEVGVVVGDLGIAHSIVKFLFFDSLSTCPAGSTLGKRWKR